MVKAARVIAHLKLGHVNSDSIHIDAKSNPVHSVTILGIPSAALKAGDYSINIPLSNGAWAAKVAAYCFTRVTAWCANPALALFGTYGTLLLAARARRQLKFTSDFGAGL